MLTIGPWFRPSTDYPLMYSQAAHRNPLLSFCPSMKELCGLFCRIYLRKIFYRPYIWRTWLPEVVGQLRACWCEVMYQVFLMEHVSGKRSISLVDRTVVLKLFILLFALRHLIIVIFIGYRTVGFEISLVPAFLVKNICPNTKKYNDYWAWNYYTAYYLHCMWVFSLALFRFIKHADSMLFLICVPIHLKWYRYFKYAYYWLVISFFY